MVGLGTVLRKAGRVCIYLLQYGCTVYCVSYAASPRLCNDTSMKPTIQPNSLVLIESISALKLRLKRGDVVVVQDKGDPKSHLCKRLIAMEYDRVFNDKSGETIQVPKGHVWLEGDNKDLSEDSRDVGPFPYALMKARVYLMLAPTLKIVR